MCHILVVCLDCPVCLCSPVTRLLLLLRTLLRRYQGLLFTQKKRESMERKRRGFSLAPQFHSLVPADGCQKRRRRVERHRCNPESVPIQNFIQSRHTSRRRVVGGQQPQSHGGVGTTSCQKRRRRMKRDRANMIAVPLQSRHTSRRRVVGGQAAATMSRSRHRCRLPEAAPWGETRQRQQCGRRRNSKSPHKSQASF
jgi:hypothetical protein